MIKTLFISSIILLSTLASFGMPQYSPSQADSLLEALYEQKNLNRKEAKKLCADLIVVFENAGDTCQMIRAITKQASLEISSSNYTNAVSNLIEAQRLFDAGRCDSEQRIQILLKYNSLYYSINEFEKADSVALLGIRLYDRSKPDKKNLMDLYLAVGGGYNKYLYESLPYIDTAYQMAVDANNLRMQETALINKGVAYANNEDFQEALKYMLQAVPMVKKRKAYGSLSSLYNNLAGLSEDEDYTLMYVDSALYYAYKAENLHDIQLYTENKAYFYSTIGDFEEGYYLLWESMVLKDSLLNIKKIEAIAQLEEKYEAEKKSNEIQTLKVENLNVELKNLNFQRNQNRLFVGLGVLILLAIFLGFAVISIRRHRNSLAIKNIEIDKARQVSDELLLNILPAEIAEELKEKGSAEARKFDMVSILFTDFKEFTQTSEKMSATELVQEVNHCFKAFDGIIEKYAIEKIKTIGDAYMAAGGLPVLSEHSVKNTIHAALEMQEFIKKRKEELKPTGQPAFEMRVGIHSGPVVAGIVGVKKFQYDVWGDTVNTASRIENNCKIGRVNISEATYELIQNVPDFDFEYRGKIQAKGKGEIDMWFVELSQVNN